MRAQSPWTHPNASQANAKSTSGSGRIRDDGSQNKSPPPSRGILKDARRGSSEETPKDEVKIEDQVKTDGDLEEGAKHDGARDESVERASGPPQNGRYEEAEDYGLSNNIV